MAGQVEVSVTYVNTLDGRTKVEWWPKEKFVGRSSRIYTGESADAYLSGVPMRELTPEKVIPIPDNSVICDLCNVKIEEFPVPVVWSSYGLCKKCLDRISKDAI